MTYVIRRANAADQLETVQKEAWQDRSLCATVSPHIFFPTEKQGYSEARKTCGKCTVREECLRYIMNAEGMKSVSSREGMFAGLTPQQRVALSKTYFSQESQGL